MITHSVDRYRTEVLVIGSGAAGLSAAIAARQAGVGVAIVSRTRLGRGGSTARAGGIINAVTGDEPGDSIARHFHDTVVAGRFLCDELHVEAMVYGIVDLLPKLEELGVRFARDNGSRLLTRQAGHAYPRTLLLANHRGTDITSPLSAAVLALGVEAIDRHVAVRILAGDRGTRGAALLDPRTGTVTFIESKAVILATGGAGLFYTANGIPESTPGDGYALALDAGCELTDLEFVQFYPTRLREEGLPAVLLPYDYLLRRGAALVNSHGVDLCSKYSLPEPDMMTRADLAGAIGREMHEGQAELYFDFRRFAPRDDDRTYWTHRFGRLVAREAASGHDILARPLRVEPVVHHFMGGICCDPVGRTTIPGLLVCGEAATGVHGANRLAGNAFTHAIVSGFSAGSAAAEFAQSNPWPGPLRASDFDFDSRADRRRCAEKARIDELVLKLKRILTNCAGPCRSSETLRVGLGEIQAILDAAPDAKALTVTERATAPTFPGLARVAKLLLLGALAREESRGAHIRVDFAGEQDAFQVHLVHDRNGRLRQRPVARTSIRYDLAGEVTSPPHAAPVGTIDQE